MKFLISVIDDLTNSGTPDEMAAINAFNDELRAKLAYEASKACNRKVELRPLH